MAVIEFNATSTGPEGQVQVWPVPADGEYRITAYGAQGGGFDGGLGARAAGTFNLLKGETLQIIVGHRGLTNNYAYSGGGGSFLSAGANPVLVAGGGGGSPGAYSANRHGSDLTEGRSGDGGEEGALGGAGGNGGESIPRAAGGGGIIGDGEDSTDTGFDTVEGGFSFINGSFGGDGTIPNGQGASGGFGGGGAAYYSGWSGAAGGGGYSGGGAAYVEETPSQSLSGGGGGSYSAGTSPEIYGGETTEGNSGDGKVIIETPDAGDESKVSGIVQIDGTPAQRTVRAFGYGPTNHDIDGETVNQSKSLGHSTSDPETGEYTIDLLAGYGQEIFVVAFDDYGDAFTAERAMTVGDRIHPTTPNGHVFECTGAGSLPAEEPVWIVDTETAQLYGSASMIARVFYRPMVQGPVAPEVNEAGPVGDEFFESVSLLIHFDDPVNTTTFFDSSNKQHPITISGTPTNEDIAVFGNAGRFSTNEGLIISDDLSLKMVDEDFTIEAFVQPASGGSLSIMYMKGLNTLDGMLLSVSTSAIFMRNVDSGTDLETSVSLDPNTFYHLAFQRVGDLRQIWLDGQKVAEDTLIFTHSSGEPTTIGGYHPGVTSEQYLFDGRIDEFRITKGVARYTEGFTPPTEPFLDTGST